MGSPSDTKPHPLSTLCFLLPVPFPSLGSPSYFPNIEEEGEEEVLAQDPAIPVLTGDPSCGDDSALHPHSDVSYAGTREAESMGPWPWSSPRPSTKSTHGPCQVTQLFCLGWGIQARDQAWSSSPRSQKTVQNGKVYIFCEIFL